MLRNKVLEEIPFQIVEYFESIGRPPNPPRSHIASRSIRPDNVPNTGVNPYQISNNLGPYPVPPNNFLRGMNLGTPQNNQNMAAALGEAMKLSNIQLQYPARNDLKPPDAPY